MTLVKTSLLNGIAVVIKLLTLLGINKLLALYIGPSGYAAIGQFQSAVQMITSFASGAINTGVTKYTAEHYEDEEYQHKIWRSAGSISLIVSTLTAVLVAIFNRQLAGWFLKDESMAGVFTWFAATLVFFVMNAFLLAILNGKKEIHRYVFANILGSIFALICTGVLTNYLGLYGALIALAIYQSLTFIVTFLLTYRASWFKLRYIFGSIDIAIAKNLGKFVIMALTTAVCVPLSHILIRNHLGETLDWSAAGYWEAMWRLSSAYLMLVTTPLTVYYLPKLSELKDKSDIKVEVIRGYRIILPITIAFSLIIYLLRDLIVVALFSENFLPMERLFAWQMVGDTLKVASFIIGYTFISKARYKLFMFIEVYFSIQFYLLIIYFVNIFGLEGASIAYAINYLISFIFVYFVYVYEYRDD